MYSNSAYDLCYGYGGTFANLYTNSPDPIGFGDVLYTNSLLTVPFTGYAYVKDVTYYQGELYDVQTTTGQIIGTTTCI